jgi:hypothetical protein
MAYLKCEMRDQEKMENTWRIQLEVVKENQGIENFQASRHNMWIQAKRDPKKKFLHLRYHVTGKRCSGI